MYIYIYTRNRKYTKKITNFILYVAFRGCAKNAENEDIIKQSIYSYLLESKHGIRLAALPVKSVRRFQWCQQICKSDEFPVQ